MRLIPRRALYVSVSAAIAVVVAVACEDAEPASEPPSTQVVAPAPTAGAAPTPTSVPTPEPTPGVVVPEVSPNSVLESLLDALLQAGSLHFDMEMEATLTFQGVKIDLPLTFVGYYLLPDRIQGEVTLDLPFFQIAKNIVSVQGNVFIADAGGESWTQIDAAAAFFARPDLFVGVQPESLKEISVVGIETLAEAALYHLKGTTIAGAFGESSGEFEVSYWIGVEDGLVSKLEANGEFNLAESDPNFGGVFTGKVPVTIRLELSGFGDPVVIESPTTSSE